MSDSTTGAGARDVFPTTRWTVIREARDPASSHYRESLEVLARTYWRPVFAYLRRKWGKARDEALDLTQGFFAALCEKDFLRHVSPEHGRFRSYVMASLDNYVRLDFRSQSALKRGGGVARISLDVGEGYEPESGHSPEETFLREWARSVLGEAVRELEAECRGDGRENAFRIFSARDLELGSGPPSYDALAERFGTSVTEVTNVLYRLRKRLREMVLNRVRDTVTSDREAEDEMRELFGRRLQE